MGSTRTEPWSGFSWTKPEEGRMDPVAAARMVESARIVRDEARARLVLDLVPILDLLATTNAETAGEERAAAERLKLVQARLEGVLVRHGLERIETEGRPFDRMIHEAVESSDVVDPQLEGIVIDELDIGYRFAGKVLRRAKVTVGARSEPHAEALHTTEGPHGAAWDGAKPKH